MFALAWLLLPDLPEYRTGLIIVGLARCIAMVIIWNDLACGDGEAAAVLVALNSIFQVVMFAALGCTTFDPARLAWIGAGHHQRAPWQIAKSVLIFLGIPLVAGYLSRRLGEKSKGELVRVDVPAQRRAMGAVRVAVHRRHPLRPARATRSPATHSTSSRIAVPLARLTSPSCGAAVTCLGTIPRTGLPAHNNPRLHRCGQQLRTGHRRRHRYLRRTSGQALAGVVGPTHRSSRRSHPGLRITCPATAIHS